jgi:transposase
LKLVFVDETAAATNMARRYGRRRRGQRLRCGVPHGHYKAITFVFGLRQRGVVAPKAYDHAMNAQTFEAWLEHHLLPTLEEGDIVVLDNLKAHKSPRVAEILARRNCTVKYLPPYSPDFNPIEMAISKLKSAYENWPSAPSPASSPSWRAASISSSPSNASTSSRPADMISLNSKPLTQLERIPL